MSRALVASALLLTLAVATACGGPSTRPMANAGPSATATAAPPSLGPVILYSEYAGSPPDQSRRSVVQYDLSTRREISSFEVGGGEEYPAQIVVGGGRVIVNLGRRIVSYNFDGSEPRELRRAPDGGYVIGIGISPDRAKLAVTEQRPGMCSTPDPVTGIGTCRPWADVTSIFVIDASDGRELMSVPQTDARFAGYAGQAALVTWRDDNRGFAVSGLTQSEAPGGLATVMLDGGVRLDAGAAYTYARLAPNARYLVGGTQSYICGLGGAVEQHDLSIRDLDSGQTLASLSDPVVNFEPMEWSPDSSEYLYKTYRLNPTPDGCATIDEASVAWHTLRLDGSPPASEPDPYTVRRRWYHNRVIEFRCNGEPALTSECISNSPSPPPGWSVPSEVFVDGKSIGEVLRFELLAFLDQ